MRVKLSSIKIGGKEKVDKFCDRFEAVIRESELCAVELPFTDTEKRCAFYKAVCEEFPGLGIGNPLKKFSPVGGYLTLEEIKATVLQLAADKNERQDENGNRYAQANIATAGTLASNLTA